MGCFLRRASGRSAVSLAQVQAETLGEIVRYALGRPGARGPSGGHRAEIAASKGALINKAGSIEELADRTGSSRNGSQGGAKTFASIGAARGAQAGGSSLPFGLPSGLPPGYALDASDPDLLLLLREDGTTAAFFSARGATACGIMEAAEQDVHPAPNGWRP